MWQLVISSMYNGFCQPLHDLPSSGSLNLTFVCLDSEECQFHWFIGAVLRCQVELAFDMDSFEFR
jgi:hypothetical protein